MMRTPSRLFVSAYSACVLSITATTALTVKASEWILGDIAAKRNSRRLQGASELMGVMSEMYFAASENALDCIQHPENLRFFPNEKDMEKGMEFGEKLSRAMDSLIDGGTNLRAL